MKIFYFVITLLTLFTSCSTDGDETRYFLVLLPVESVVLPSEVVVNKTHAIPVNYKLPTSCHTFDSFYFDKLEHTRTIAVQSIKVDKQDCIASDQTEVQAMLNFTPTELGPLIFKIWKGKNAGGIDIYEEFEATVIE